MENSPKPLRIDYRFEGERKMDQKIAEKFGTTPRKGEPLVRERTPAFTGMPSHHKLF